MGLDTALHTDRMTSCALCDLPADPPVTDDSVDGEFCCRGCLEVARRLGDIDPGDAEAAGTAQPTPEYPDDAEGFKIRVPGWEMAIERYESLGFSPVPMPFEEVHTALQTGAIDGRAYAPAHEVPMFADVIDAYVHTREDFEHTFWLANRDWLESLTQQQRAWIRQAAQEAVAWSWQVAERENARWLEEIEDEGVEVVTLSEQQRAQYRELVTSAERPFIEDIVGQELLTEIERAAERAAQE